MTFLANLARYPVSVSSKLGPGAITTAPADSVMRGGEAKGLGSPFPLGRRRYSTRPYKTSPRWGGGAQMVFSVAEGEF